MEILQLRYFYISAKNQNFSQTAKQFDVPTTAVSASIRRLEKELGCTLFDRTHNKIALNARGKRLQQALCVAFGQIDKAIEDISARYEDKREIKILVRGMRRKVTDLLSEFSADHPNVVFKIAFSQSAPEDYDVIIDDDKIDYAEYQKIELYNMRLHLKCAAKDPLCSKNLMMQDLRDQAFVSMDQESNMHRILTHSCNRSGFYPNIVAFCNDIACYDKLVAMGMGIGIGREASGENMEQIRDLNVADFNEHYTVFAYYRESDYFGNVKKLIDYMKENAGV